MVFVWLENNSMIMIWELSALCSINNPPVRSQL